MRSACVRLPEAEWIFVLNRTGSKTEEDCTRSIVVCNRRQIAEKSLKMTGRQSERRKPQGKDKSLAEEGLFVGGKPGLYRGGWSLLVMGSALTCLFTFPAPMAGPGEKL